MNKDSKLLAEAYGEVNKSNDTQKKLAKFAIDFKKLLLKHPGVTVSNDTNDRLNAYMYSGIKTESIFLPSSDFEAKQENS